MMLLFRLLIAVLVWSIQARTLLTKDRYVGLKRAPLQDLVNLYWTGYFLALN